MDTILESQTECYGSEEGSDSEENISDELRALTIRLLPLKHAEEILVSKIFSKNEEAATGLNSHAVYTSPRRSREIFVRPGSGWKGLLARWSSSTPANSGASTLESDEPQELLHSCRGDIMTMWNDPTVRDILRRRKVRLEEFPGLYVHPLPSLSV
jgi:hypothetical protein